MPPARTSHPAPLRAVTLRDAFWDRYTRLVRDKVLPYQWEVLNDRVPGAERSHAVENFRIAAGLAQGEFHGYVFQDSDLAKWLEAVAYRLTTDPDPALEAAVDEVIALVGQAQQPDGYLDTYYIVAQPGRRWTDERRKHELYCAGHLMEAAVAYFEATGKRVLLDIACRLAGHIRQVFGPGPGQKRVLPGFVPIWVPARTPPGQHPDQIGRPSVLMHDSHRCRVVRYWPPGGRPSGDLWSGRSWG